MAWKAEYDSKVISNEEAVRKVRSGDTVALGLCLGGVSRCLIGPLLARYAELNDVVITDAAAVWPSKLNDLDYLQKISGHIQYATYFGMKGSRKILKENAADFIPCTASDSAKKILSRSDVFMVMVSPPDEDGNVNLGISNFYNLDVIRNRKINNIRLLIGEVNEHVPGVHGDNSVHVSEFDFFVENSTPMIDFPIAAPNPQEKAIADQVIGLINDGDTLQLGIGGIPDAVAAGLCGKKDLGIFTEMLPNTLPELMNKGIVTNINSVFKKGVTIGSFGMGNAEFYTFVNGNPLVELYPSSLIVNPITISKQPNMMAINNALLVDLTGQICAEGFGHRQISGSGGQPDCHIGAYHAKNGRACTLITSAREIGKGVLIPQ